MERGRKSSMTAGGAPISGQDKPMPRPGDFSMFQFGLNDNTASNHAMTDHEDVRANEDNGNTQTPLTNGIESSLHTLCADIHAKIESFLQEDLQEETLRCAQTQCRHSLSIIQSALTRYPLAHLSLSYNGGKDCLVLLLLYLSVLSEQEKDLPPALPAIYIPYADPFPEVDTFVASSSSHYHLALTRHRSRKNSMKDAFANYLASLTGSEIKGIFVGTRRTDPHGEHLSAFDMTDHGWPSFMRIHPVLEWKYVEVWAFLKHLGVEWCSLYDVGFTSLGGIHETHPNPRLRYQDEQGKERYKPAWVLEKDEEERLGRI